MLICKTCYQNKINQQIVQFNPNEGPIQNIPELNNQIDGSVIVDVNDLLSTLQSSEMISFLCGYCKLTHVGKDETGKAKIKYNAEDWIDWNN